MFSIYYYMLTYEHLNYLGASPQSSILWGQAFEGFVLSPPVAMPLETGTLADSETSTVLCASSSYTLMPTVPCLKTFLFHLQSHSEGIFLKRYTLQSLPRQKKAQGHLTLLNRHLFLQY